ncbi:MAG: ribonuclease III [Patescibacteria group bacterium]
MIIDLNRKLEKKIGVRFKNQELLKTALTHRSYLNENRQEKLKSNERLEFLGDAVLELWATEKLFSYFSSLPEGVLTNIRAAVVCTDSLAEEGERLKLGEFLLLSRGESRGGGRKNRSLLADTFEALVGAIYLDQGWPSAQKFLNQQLSKKLIGLGEQGNPKDAKTRLQEKLQAQYRLTPSYQISQETGPDHAKHFTVTVSCGTEELTSGQGNSKKEAEEDAAAKALILVEKKGILSPRC